MPRILFCTVFAPLVLLLAQGGMGADPLALTRAWLEPAPGERSVPQVDEATRLKMIAELSELKRAAGKTRPYGYNLDVLLIDLGDEVTMRKSVEDYLGSTQIRTLRSVLYSSRQAGLVELLGPFLFIDEPTEPVSWKDLEFPRRSVAAGNICMDMVRRCPEFDKATKDWAESVMRSWRNGIAWREEIRAFWKENQEHLKAKNYRAVRPPSTAGATPSPPQSATNRTSAAPALPIPTPVSTSRVPAIIAGKPPAPQVPTVAAITKPAPVSPLPPTSAATAPDSPAPPPAWPWLVVVGIVLAGFLWRRPH